MQRASFSSIFFLLATAAAGQQKVPVFASASDSAAYFSTEERFMHALKNPRYTARIDSLSRVMGGLREKAIRFRIAYAPSNQFTRYNQRPKDLLSVTKLSLVDYKGTTLPDSLFLMTNLKELELINTRIRKLPARLNELKALEKLTLFNNKSRGRIRLSKNHTIKTFGMHDDEHDFRPRSYRNLSALQSLDFSRSNLTEFPRLRGVGGLKRLVLTDNLLTLQKMPKSPPALEELVLTSNRISALPPSIGNYSKLKKLNLNANNLQALPPEIGKLQMLEELFLYKSSLRTLPREVYDLKNLRVIDLYYNHLDQLDSSLGRWANLEILYVANNNIFSVPESIGSLRKLKELYLHHNRISNLPSSLGNLDSLKVLRVNNNLLVEFPSAVLRLKAMENLDVSGNQIQQVPEKVFELPALQILSLKQNPLEPDSRSMAIQRARQVLETRQVVIHLEGLMEPGSN